MQVLFDERQHPLILRIFKREKYFTIAILILDVVLILIFLVLFFHSRISLPMLVIVIGIALLILWIAFSSHRWIPLLTSEGIILLKKFAVYSKFKEFRKIKYTDISTVIFSRRNENGLIMLVYSAGNIIKSVFFRSGKEVIDAKKFIQILSKQNVNIISLSFPVNPSKVKELVESRCSEQGRERVKTPDRRIG